MKTRFGTPRMRSAGSGGRCLTNTIPEIRNMNEISMLSPIRIWKLVSPVVVQTAARSVKCSTSAFATSLIQSTPHSASPASTALQLRRSTSTA